MLLLCRRDPVRLQPRRFPQPVSLNRAHSRSFFVLILIAAVMLAVPFKLTAQERKYAFGTNIELVGGGTNSLRGLRTNPTRGGQRFFLFYGAYPTVNMTVNGPRTPLSTSYAFGLSQTETSSKLHSNSHAASVKVSHSLGVDWKLNALGSFELTDDAFTFNSFRGVPTATEDLLFVFDPVAARRS